MSKPRINACPVCGKPEDPSCSPFCSPRCRKLDLSRWLNEVYVVPGDEAAEPAGSGGADDE